MNQKKYDSNFSNSYFDPSGMINDWAVDQKTITSWVNLNGANMIFVPVIDNDISHNHFFCSQCKKWFTIHNSTKNIKRHAKIHIPELVSEKDMNKNENSFFTKEQEKYINEKIISFIIFGTQTFQYVENFYLRSLSSSLPNRNKITKILEKVCNLTIEEIKSKLIYSSSNSLTFDEWSSKSNVPYLGITVRSFINLEYHDFFLDLIEINSETASSSNLAIEVRKSLEKYNIDTESIVSVTTDNCSTMISTCDILNLFRIPCVCHLLNLIFKEFVEKISTIINPFFELVSFLTRSNKYTIFVNNQKIKKVPSYTNVRWTSFCKTVLILLETKEHILSFCLRENREVPNESEWKKLSLLKRLCEQYVDIVKFFEADQFGASGYFLLYIDIIRDKFIELKKTVFQQGAKCARNKIKELQKKHSNFWNTIAPAALLLNPSLPYNNLLTPNEVSQAKSFIIGKMKKYEVKQTKSQNQYPEYMKKYYENIETIQKAPLQKILDERNLNLSTETLKKFWFEKIDTNEKSLALVAIDILGAVITSVASERSFSRGRLVVNEQRTRISSDHANQQMIVQLNSEIAQDAISRTNIFH